MSAHNSTGSAAKARPTAVTRRIQGVSATLDCSDTARTHTSEQRSVSKCTSKARRFISNWIQCKCNTSDNSLAVIWYNITIFSNVNVILFICIFKAICSYLTNYQIVSHPTVRRNYSGDFFHFIGLAISEEIIRCPWHHKIFNIVNEVLDKIGAESSILLKQCDFLKKYAFKLFN